MMSLPPPEVCVDEYRDAQPFPHLVLDGAFDYGLLRAAAAEFPPVDDPRWHTFTGEREQGKQQGDAAICGRYVEHVHVLLASLQFVSWLAIVTDEPMLCNDQARVGGGVHQVRHGGRLAMHVDFDQHPDDPTMQRAVNVLLFLNDRWQDEWGGWLVLGDPNVAASPHGAQVIAPTLGRLVIFPAGDDTWHGHPWPYDGPDDHPRRSIPAYYYRPRVDADGPPRSTMWLADQPTA